MAKRKQASPPKTDQAAWTQGVNLACDLLAGASGDNDEMVLPSNAREGRPQDNLVHRYLLKLRDVGDSRVEIAFSAVLTDFISSSVDGGVPDTDLLRTLAGKPVPQRAVGVVS